MSVLQVGGQSQRFTVAVDTTLYNPSSSVSILVGNLTPDTPIPPQGAFTLAAGTYRIQTADGSVQPVDLIEGLGGVIPSPAQIATQLTNSGLASAIATDLIAAGVMKDSTGTNIQLNTSAAGIPSFLKAGSQGVTTEIAALIATGLAGGLPGGVPLLVFQNNIDKLANRVIAHGAQYQSATFPVNQPGFDFVLQVTIPAGNTTPDLQVDLIWTDTTTGVATLVTDRYYFPATQNGSNSFGGFGKTKGNQLQVIMTNLDTAQSMTVSYGISQNSRIPARDDIRSVAFNGRGATGTVDQDPGSLVLILVQANIAANNSSSFALPFFSGRCKVMSGPQAAAYRYQITAPAYGDAGSLATAQTIVYDTNALAATASVSDYFMAPRAGMIARIFNNSAGAANINCSIFAEV